MHTLIDLAKGWPRAVVLGALVSACSVGKIGDADVDDVPGANVPPTNSGAGMGSSLGGGSSTTGGASTGSSGSGNTGAGPATGSGGTTGTGGGPQTCTVGTGTPARVRRLTLQEYDQSISELLGKAVTPSTSFPKDSQSDGYTNNADSLVVTPLLAEALGTAAEQMAKAAVASLATLVPCAPASGNEACARTFIQTFGARAYRRDLVQAEVDSLIKVYGVGAQGMGGFAGGIELVLTTIFQSPAFLYRTELGTAATPGTAPLDLTAREIAVELAYLISGGLPDADLLAAADAGTLASADGRAAQAARLLDLPKARLQLPRFFFQWLGIDKIEDELKDPSIYPAFTPVLAEAMRAETTAFVQNVVFDGESSIAELFTAPYTFANSQLASFYKFPAVTGTQLVKVPVDATQRAGILTHGSVLSTFAQSTQSSPVKRGKFVRTRLLCQTLPLPPKNLMIVPPPPSSTNTTRERFAVHASGTCQGCHQLMDPIGFGFENFDGIGVYRNMENGFPVDSSGALAGTDVDGPFVGVVELGERLADSEMVRNCFAQNWFQFAMARGAIAADRCTLDTAFAKFLKSEGTIRDLFIDIVRADEFVRRLPQRK